MALYLELEKCLLEDTKAYLYRWTHIPSNKWYVGSRTASGSHPNDGYYCSSKHVKPLIMKNPGEWKREILAIGDPKYILTLEAKFLSTIDAKNDPMSFNMHNGDGKFTTAGTSWTDEQREKAKVSYSLSRKGKQKSDAHKKSIAKSLTGKTKTVQHRDALSASQQLGVYSDGTFSFKSSREAARFANVSQPTLLKWVKNNLNGWSFKPKGNK